MDIIIIRPQGYCYGVVDAMVIARNASLDASLPRPIYILGMLVHNQQITTAFEKIGIHTIDGKKRENLLATIEKGTVIFTAHGVSPQIKKIAHQKGLTTIDATCPDVMVTHERIVDKIAHGYEVLYIGKKNHPEPEGALGIAPNHVHLISTLEDIYALTLPTEKLFVTNQTTMSQWDVAELMTAIRSAYPHAVFHKEVCEATQLRQEAVVNQAKGCDLLLVVGDSKSNNSNRLAQVAIEQAGVMAYRVSDVSKINPKWLVNTKKIAVTAGASTPTQLVREVITYLQRFDPTNPATFTGVTTLTAEEILPRGRKKDLTSHRAQRIKQLRSGENDE